MYSLPFRSLDEAKQNASALHKEFAFFSLLRTPLDGEPPQPFSLQQLHYVIARVMGCSGWTDLASRITLNERAEYLDENGATEDSHRDLVKRFSVFVHHKDKTNRIYRSLHAIAFGCGSQARSKAPIGIQNRMWRVTDDFDKCSEVFLIRQGRIAMSRYDHLMSPYEAKILDWRVERKIALILGQKVPSKPRPPKL